MKLVVISSPDGKPLHARVRTTVGELKTYIESFTSLRDEDIDIEEVIDMFLDPISEYQLVIGLEGKLDKWDNQATLEQIQDQTRS